MTNSKPTLPTATVNNEAFSHFDIRNSRKFVKHFANLGHVSLQFCYNSTLKWLAAMKGQGKIGWPSYR